MTPTPPDWVVVDTRTVTCTRDGIRATHAGNQAVLSLFIRHHTRCPLPRPAAAPRPTPPAPNRAPVDDDSDEIESPAIGAHEVATHLEDEELDALRTLIAAADEHRDHHPDLDAERLMEILHDDLRKIGVEVAEWIPASLTTGLQHL